MSENKMEVDLCTPTENLKKHCQEITPDNPTQPERKSLLGAKKVLLLKYSTFACLVPWYCFSSNCEYASSDSMY